MSITSIRDALACAACLAVIFGVFRGFGSPAQPQPAHTPDPALLAPRALTGVTEKDITSSGVYSIGPKKADTVVLEFSREGCHWCIQEKPEIEKKVSAKGDTLLIADIVKSPEARMLADRLKVQGTPTFVRYDRKTGKTRMFMFGDMDAELK